MRHDTDTGDDRRGPLRGAQGATAVQRTAMTVRPIGFWLYVAAGMVMIVASTLAMPFMASRTR